MTNYIFYGLVTSAVSFVYTLILYFLGFHTEKMEQGAVLGYLGIVIMIVGMILSIREAKKDSLEDKQDFKYGSAFKAGFLTVLFIAVGSAVFSYVYMEFINTDMADYALQMQESKLLEQGKSQEEVDMAANFMRGFLTPFAQSISALIGTIITGTLLSLIIAIFLKGKSPESVEV